MKRFLFFFAFVAFAVGLVSAAEESKPQKIKTGWNFGPLPAVSFSTERGFQYGALCEIYNYGDGKVFPGYYHKFNVELSHYTKGSSNLHLFYDSKFLIPGVRFTAAVSYIPDKMSEFYGFNGDVSVYNKDYDKSDKFDGAGNSLAYYNIRKDMFRAVADFQGQIGKLPLNWIAGLAYYDYSVGNVSGKKYEKYKVLENNTLYSNYVRYGIIPESQKDGGSMLDIKAGLVLDTRDHEAAPNKGFCAEAALIGSFIGRNNPGYLNYMAHWRHYITLAKNRLVFAYHLAFQGNLMGETPWFALNNVYTSYFRQIRSEGVGGQNSVRGMMRNRLTASGYAWANFEMRVKLFEFNLINQYWYVAANPFFDLGYITQTYRMYDQVMAKYNFQDNDFLLVNNMDQNLHYSAGLGLKIVMNYNFIISAEFAKSFREQDGNTSLAIQLNYIF
ncbi:MAG: hypothetical protein MJY71_07890 [Bacteroidaceae bacterium]|nr:hypothetical protein [Bacteroidaceae bacterium]